MKIRYAISMTLGVLAMAGASRGAVTVDYIYDAGGNNPGGPDGLAARATYEIDGNQLTILLENTSTGAPMDALVADTLLVSLGFNLPDGVLIDSGVSALIGPGSIGLGAWSGLGEGDSVAQEWLWTNEFGGDLLAGYAQVISTSEGQGDGDHMRFDGVLNGLVDGPFGGIAADPPILPVPDEQVAASDSLIFTLMLTDTVSELELSTLAHGAAVEFGSDYQYLVPTPAALPAMFMPFLFGRRRRRGAR
jgi:hypothetical protein